MLYLNTHVFRDIHDLCYYTGKLENLVLTHGRGKKFFSSLKHPHLLWDPPSLLFSDYWLLFPWWRSSQGMNLATNPCLVSRL